MSSKPVDSIMNCSQLCLYPQPFLQYWLRLLYHYYWIGSQLQWCCTLAVDRFHM